MNISQRALLLKSENAKLTLLKSSKKVELPQGNQSSILGLDRDKLRKTSSKKILASLRKVLSYSNIVKVENNTILVDFKLVPDYAIFKQRLEQFETAEFGFG